MVALKMSHLRYRGRLELNTQGSDNFLDFRHFPRVSVFRFHSPPGFAWSVPENADVVP